MRDLADPILFARPSIRSKLQRDVTHEVVDVVGREKSVSFRQITAAGVAHERRQLAVKARKFVAVDRKEHRDDALKDRKRIAAPLNVLALNHDDFAGLQLVNGAMAPFSESGVVQPSQATIAIVALSKSINAATDGTIRLDFKIDVACCWSGESLVLPNFLVENGFQAHIVPVLFIECSLRLRMVRSQSIRPFATKPANTSLGHRKSL